MSSNSIFATKSFKSGNIIFVKKRSIEEVEVAIAATTSLVTEIKNMEDKIYNENIPEYDDPLNLGVIIGL